MRTVLNGILCLILLPLVSKAKLNVVATLPDFAALAQEIGGGQITVTALAKGSEDAHFVDAKPSFLRVLNRADVLLEGGAELEIGWLPPLVNGARNAKVLPGKTGRVSLAQNIRLLDVPETHVDRSQGDVHAFGNPHYWLDPANGKIIAAQIAEVFSQLDPPSAPAYRQNLNLFSERLDQKLTEWTRLMAPWRGTKVITYHKSYEYFAARFGLDIAGQIEPKPGLAPSSTHVNGLIARAKEQGVKLIMIEPFRARKTPQYVADSIGAKLLVIPDKVGANEKVKDYFSLFDYVVGQITAALDESK